MVAVSRTAEFRARLATVQGESRRLRLEAFIPYAPTVAGFRLGPLTFSTYAHLQGWGNAFVCGGPIRFKDIFQFIWVHHPEFGQFSTRARRRVARQLDRHLSPLFGGFNALVHFMAPVLSGSARRARWWSPLPLLAALCRRLRRPTAPARFDAACAEIRALLREATHDFPTGSEEGEPLPHALAPQFVSLLVRGYGVDFSTARELVAGLPLRQLMQFIREILHRLSQGKEKLLTAEEAQVWADYLDHKTTALNT